MLNDAFQHNHEQHDLNNNINSTYTQYELEMIKKYKSEVSYEELEIYKDKNLFQFQFVDQLKVKNLVLYGCFSLVFDKVPVNIVQLTVNECKLKSILGIQFMTNLKRLDLSNNLLADIQSLNLLVQLQHLHVNENKLVNIQPLSTLKQLQSLSLANNRIIDLQPIKQLRRLLSLDLSHNSIQSVLCLQNLTLLQSLNLSFNNIHPAQLPYPPFKL
ncbi:CotH_kinase family protein [Hexamita inflata]|uniref:CotH kinase family protein n=1 Tax=Hexamita inflata TaxID=28002 RepID=A0AA86QUB8_9EUKA|nr:CotH kinase family protein [Hexamita inflata]